MNRRNFMGKVVMGGGTIATAALSGLPAHAHQEAKRVRISESGKVFKADLIIAGGGLGGCSAAFAALRNGLSVVMTEETDWLGGQLSQQGVPPDEHQWIETHGAPELYRVFREKIRDYYKRCYPLTPEAASNKRLNPGGGSVSRLCFEPKVGHLVLQEMFASYESSRKLIILKQHKIQTAKVHGKRVQSLTAKNLITGNTSLLEGEYFVDATELGDLLPLTGTAYVTGSEAKGDTGEFHAGVTHRPENNQAFTVCFAMDYVKGEDWTIPKPSDYEFWRNFEPQMNPPWAGKMLELNYSNPKNLKPKALGFHPEGGKTGNNLNLMVYRKIIAQKNHQPGFYEGDATLVNWPQNDYVSGNIVDVSEETFKKHVDAGKQQSLSLLYWLQTEAPRPDGGKGWPGLRLRNDLMGTEDGLAKYPYVRESRRIKSLFTVLEEHVGATQRAQVSGLEGKDLKAAVFHDSVGIGYYHIDLHPSCEGDNYIDFGSLPFQIPLGALIPQETENLLPANKNIGTTHITNGCYRLHPVEWSIGEAVGMLVPFAISKKEQPKNIRENSGLLNEFQSFVRSQGIETNWPES
ncbi:FAD-dependent oxidoreductase [Cyclobacterium marinum]|uniref:Fumarate reductase/succinate dehydrogenase flavoprotein domain protein n=1 Tax=Cyclobacterium marinum (strain ATCC 25205 / DSM 745 / LMG 13164 / NCIMB 1802) TaxID=880070 RepID=G0J7C7_CYCMS|nr:FAD-dependent oxidoreductase [Cyclobacterium marinum]AEL28581.1 fumarate reductase/succinate dehydrogenase flavoprotein domain protein [Cyclobacterium marinum DSM 745]